MVCRAMELEEKEKLDFSSAMKKAAAEYREMCAPLKEKRYAFPPEAPG